jgi:hypothetical protein
MNDTTGVNVILIYQLKRPQHLACKARIIVRKNYWFDVYINQPNALFILSLLN